MGLLRMLRNVGLGAILLVGLGAFPAIQARAAGVPSGPEVVPNSTCGSCHCDPGQCCNNGWFGCSCTNCPSPPPK